MSTSTDHRSLPSLRSRAVSSARMLRAAPLRVLTGIAVAMVLTAVYAACLKLERLLFGLSIDQAQVDKGVALPAAAFDGSSSGVLTVSTAGDLSDPFSQTSVSGSGFVRTIREIVLPYYLSELINAVLVLALASVVLLLCLRLLRGGPFVTGTTAGLAIFAGLLAVGSITSQLVRRGAFGTESLGVEQAREGAAWVMFGTRYPGLGLDTTRIPYDPGATPGLDLFPLGIAVLIAVIATAFWLGHRMQRDTQGLV